MNNPIQRFVTITYPRTRSNYLLSILNQHHEIACDSEILDKNIWHVYRPRFEELAEKSPRLISELDKRFEDIDNNPVDFLEMCYKLLACEGRVVGFKLLNNHDTRIHKYIIENRDVKKIILVRNYLYSHISFLHALETQEWTLFEGKKGTDLLVDFYLKPFTKYVNEITVYLKNILEQLDKSNQKYLVCFSEDVGKKEWWQEITEFLGVEMFESTKTILTKQNPDYLEERVNNYKGMVRDLMYTKYSYLLHGDFFPDRINWLLGDVDHELITTLYRQLQQIRMLEKELSEKKKETSLLYNSQQWKKGQLVVKSIDRAFGWIPTIKRSIKN